MSQIYEYATPHHNPMSPQDKKHYEKNFKRMHTREHEQCKDELFRTIGLFYGTIRGMKADIHDPDMVQDLESAVEELDLTYSKL